MPESPLKTIASKVAEILGEPVECVVIRCRSGSRIRIEGDDLPAPATVAKKDTERERRIKAERAKVIEFMRSKGMAVSRKQIARGLGYESCTSYVGIATKEMIADGTMIDEDGDETYVLNDAD